MAIESAGLILASSDPRAVVGIIRLSKAAYRKSLQNLWWAAGYNILAIPIAAGALQWAGITMPPALAAILMSISTIVVAANAQLLRRVELRPEALATDASETAEAPDQRVEGTNRWTATKHIRDRTEGCSSRWRSVAPARWC